MQDEVRRILERCKSVEDFIDLPDNDKKALMLQYRSGERLKTENAFLGKTEKVRYKVFDLPQKLTCPGKTAVCESNCYQRSVENRHRGQGRDSAVLCARKLNLFASLQEDFVQRMIAELKALRPGKNQEIRVRIHASGDFYSKEYMESWFIICLVLRLYEKNYTFTAYTKSFEILDSILSNQNRLLELRKEAYEFAGLGDCEENVSELGLKDFNIHIIGSVMNDTDDKDIRIIEKYRLPKYIVVSHATDVCINTTCAECSKCYRYPMKDVQTKLR